MGSKFLKTLWVAGLIILSGFFSPAQAQQTPTPPQIEHLPLSLDLAKQAIDATLFIRKNYKDREIGDGNPTDMVSAMHNKGVYNKMLVELKQFGFANPESWSKAAMSTAMAVGFMRKNGDRTAMAQMLEMQKDTRMSAQLKEQLMATMKSMMPPQTNMDVAQKLLADQRYRVKVDQLFDN